MTTATAALPPHLAQSKLTLEQFDALLTKIYEGPLEDVPWGGALEQIRVHLHANYATMILRWPASGHAGLMINASENSAPLPGVASYNSYYYALDPFVNLPTDRVVTVDELLGAGVWRNSAMYVEFLKPLDVGHLMGADLHTHDGVECRFRVCRSHRDHAFSATDKAVCNALLPHLKRAVRLHAKFGMVESERTLYASTIDRMLVGTAILDERGAIMKTNSVADEIFAECDGLRVRGGALEASYPLEDRKLQKLIRQVLAERTGSTPSVAHAIAVPRPSGKPRLGVLIRAVPLSEWSEDNPRRPACAVFIRDAERKSQASHEIVRKLFDLTPAETALALALVNGQTLEEAADELAISKNTARSHLRAIFSKTGVTRQATLVRLLLNSVLSLG
ncbi:TPA: helix-turn-helix transcriptional regulator [Burkholderia cenocepacia]|uniref:helix-turn-helix transcriptional regulator n=1 Tax=Burkholderia cenocepacia TaxID=95486 RepID=UPI001904A460|nr:LuxR family transcriptional regulator [Burkholderia cenocepacia]MBJ9918489.1 helix-turn-helix transcriptional regulator [Burkholderia cenocepacia]MBR8114754.1 helix-turn-helix transcriptional regulator [Burkholderia cenocepacia]MBR8369266.1 helix-turn-helix transcriptional regulator [Burkholderia cenocepacia]MBR8381851.1 helix-turn-helix transcriptional regulator [Burkholderia cenocepacia]MBR8438065.1 helix-turn-helix transcriptional regulator [Burkholderia cenocepacia]